MPVKRGQILKKREFCRNGHRFTKKNTILTHEGKYRRCKKCYKAANKRWHIEHQRPWRESFIKIYKRLEVLERAVGLR